MSNSINDLPWDIGHYCLNGNFKDCHSDNCPHSGDRCDGKEIFSIIPKITARELLVYKKGIVCWQQAAMDLKQENGRLQAELGAALLRIRLLEGTIERHHGIVTNSRR